MDEMVNCGSHGYRFCIELGQDDLSFKYLKTGQISLVLKTK